MKIIHKGFEQIDKDKKLNSYGVEEMSQVGDLISKIGLLGFYDNGNYRVAMLKDGTKIRISFDPKATKLVPKFAENCDFQISSICDAGCSYCYAGATKNGKYADLRNLKFLDTLHSYTELAINGNDMSHPDLEWFLEKMKEKKILTNLTINQFHFDKFYDKLVDYKNRGLLHGIGVSLNDKKEINQEFKDKVAALKDGIIHVIAGILTEEQIEKLKDDRLKVLFLGYKTKCRGVTYYDKFANQVKERINWLADNIMKIRDYFAVVSFDNLALEQLDMQNKISPEDWELLYMGDDGSYTFYIDGVTNMFFKDSIQEEGFEIKNNVDDMFEVILEKYANF